MPAVDQTGSPYSIDPAANASLVGDVRDVEERVALLRDHGKLTPETLEKYYGATRFEQVAESNAIEGSTLSVGETQLAVLKGVTLTGHDPQFSRDARQLDAALQRLAVLAKVRKPTDMSEVKELNELILGPVPFAGSFRKVPVIISGSEHRPPKTWQAVMAAMEEWDKWSGDYGFVSPVIRAGVLHAWLTHIHPFIDGNGRTARAVGNLELVRAGYPPIVIKRSKHRDRYIDALAESDRAGNLGPLLALVLDRVRDALRDLERAATVQGYDPVLARLRRRQEASLHVWTAATDLLFSLVVEELGPLIETANGSLTTRRYRESLGIDDYLTLCKGEAISESWAFRLDASVPAVAPVVRLAWFGYRTSRMQAALASQNGAMPSIFWSRQNPVGYPPWLRLAHGAPGGEEMTLVRDRWHVLRAGKHLEEAPSELAQQIAKDVLDGDLDL